VVLPLLPVPLLLLLLLMLLLLLPTASSILVVIRNLLAGAVLDEWFALANRPHELVGHHVHAELDVSEDTLLGIGNLQKEGMILSILYCTIKVSCGEIYCAIL